MIAVKIRTTSFLLATLILVLLIPVSSVSANGESPITLFSIEGVTPPAPGANPVRTITPTSEYTGTVTWFSSAGELSEYFEAATVYSAIIEIFPVDGYTLTGVVKNSFTVEGAWNVTNQANSGIIAALFIPESSDAAEFLDESFNDGGSISIKDIFGEIPINESGTVLCPIKVDEIASDSLNRIIALASFYAPSSQVAGASGASETSIGAGYQNSENISFQASSESWSPEVVAAIAALEYQPSDLEFQAFDDWYLPSRAELNALYEQRAIVDNLSASSYWSSSEHSSSSAYYKSFVNGLDSITCKGASHAVRPIRAGTGDSLSVGETGPGGGKIFYVSTESFSCGPTLILNCNYLEVAPDTWLNQLRDEPYISWSADPYIDNHILFRLNSDGSYDNTFGSPETVLTRDTGNEMPKKYTLVTTTSPYYISEELSLEIASDDKILVSLSGFTEGPGGYHNFLARYTSYGILDESFGDDGDGVIGNIITPPEDDPERLFVDFAIDSENHILVASFFPETFTAVKLERFQPDGSIDGDFGTNGSVVIEMSYPEGEARSRTRVLRVIADDADGYLIGFTGVFFDEETDTPFTQLHRINLDGTVDNNFTSPLNDASDQNFIVEYFFLTDLVSDGPSGFLMSGTFLPSFEFGDWFGTTLRFTMSGDFDMDFNGLGPDPQSNPLISQSCANTALLHNGTAHQSNVGILSAHFCNIGFDYGSLKAFTSSGVFLGEFYLGANPNNPEFQLITQLSMTRAGKLLILNGARPTSGFLKFFIEDANRPEEDNNYWTNATISRYFLPNTNTPLGITGPEQVKGVVGTPIDPVSFTVTGGTGIETITVTSGYELPAGLTLSTEGEISGIPLVARTTTTSFTVTDSSNETLTAYIEFVISLATTPPAQTPIPAPPPPVPYLNTLTAPKIQLKEDKLICTPGTYNAGYTIGGVNQGSSTSLFTPLTYAYNLHVNGVAQTTLAVTSANPTISWDMPVATSGALITCSVSVTANGLTNTDKSSDNAAGINTAKAAQTTSITKAEADYSASLIANDKIYQKSLIDNRNKWRADAGTIRNNYLVEIARIRTLPTSKETRGLASTALKNYNAALKKNTADYKASKPAALAERDAANKIALDVKNVAIASANATYGIFIESIGYGVLVP